MKNIKIFTNNIEEKAKQQIDLLLEQEPFKDCKIRIMPDVHAGAGCVIGFTGNLGYKVIPNIVGVDIGCGMLCIKLGNIDLDLEKLDNIIKQYVPSGMNVHKEQKYKFIEFEQLYCLNELKNKDNWLEKSLGTLGGGNHFIEVDMDKDKNKYLVIHTGSRNLGKQVAEIYQNKAIEYCSFNIEMQFEINDTIKNLKEQGKQQEIQQALIEIHKKYDGKTKLPKDLCYLEGKLRDDYLHDMKICQEFAKDNRLCIAKQILCNYFEVPYYSGTNSLRLVEEVDYPSFISQDYIKYDFSYFQTIHNYIDFDDNIIRKGSIKANYGKKVIIPMNMRDGCIIAIGKGNDDWNQSAPHGAGRVMSRNMAKKQISLEDYKKSMQGIYSTSIDEETIDESPMVYKPMEEIIEYIKDTVDVIDIIKPIYNFKANE
mgnify:CR=1 FL=1